MFVFIIFMIKKVISFCLGFVKLKFFKIKNNKISVKNKIIVAFIIFCFLIDR